MTSEQGVLLFSMVSVAQAVRNLSMTLCATAWALSSTNFVPGLRLHKFRSFCILETGSGASILLPVTQHWLAERLGGGLGLVCPFQWLGPAWGWQMWFRHFVMAAPEEKTRDYGIHSKRHEPCITLGKRGPESAKPFPLHFQNSS